MLSTYIDRLTCFVNNGTNNDGATFYTLPIYFFHPPPLTYLQVGSVWDRQFSSHKGGVIRKERGCV
ncbi:hypothetical protein HanPSC8_Chr10g0434321 [Helianthus annuus]|nr:hypothetical protein HanPSC8_Chr10g0434321 [Helianthus annuus]